LAPGEKNKVTRIEYRHPDPSCNPYLASSILLKSGWEGIKKKIEPIGDIQENIFELSKKELKDKGVTYLPEHLGEAVEYFEEDKSMKEIMGDFLFENLIELKRSEYESYMGFTGVEWAASRPKITSWEYEHYLTRV
jgi:glutamine synthetase